MFMYVYVSACLCLCLYERFFICIETRYIYYKNYKLIRMWIHTSQDNLWPFFSHNNGSSFNFSFYRIGSYSVWFPIPWANAKLLSKCLPCELILHSLSALAKIHPCDWKKWHLTGKQKSSCPLWWEKTTWAWCSLRISSNWYIMTTIIKTKIMS